MSLALEPPWPWRGGPGRSPVPRNQGWKTLRCRSAGHSSSETPPALCRGSGRQQRGTGRCSHWGQHQGRGQVPCPRAACPSQRLGRCRAGASPITSSLRAPIQPCSGLRCREVVESPPAAVPRGRAERIPKAGPPAPRRSPRAGPEHGLSSRARLPPRLLAVHVPAARPQPLRLRPRGHHGHPQGVHAPGPRG